MGSCELEWKKIIKGIWSENTKQQQIKLVKNISKYIEFFNVAIVKSSENEWYVTTLVNHIWLYKKNQKVKHINLPFPSQGCAASN